MLVLKGKERDRMFIGDNIIVTIVEIREGRVRLGFEAPKEVEIDREAVRKAKLECG